MKTFVHLCDSINQSYVSIIETLEKTHKMIIDESEKVKNISLESSKPMMKSNIAVTDSFIILADELRKKIANEKKELEKIDQLMGQLGDLRLRLNLPEGNTKSSVKEKKRFYQIAYASQK